MSDGYFDGNGYVGYGYYNKRFMTSICITSTKMFCEKLHHILFEKVNINTYIRKRHKDRDTTTRMMESQGNIQVVRFLTWLYNDSDESIRMRRKYDKYLEILKVHEARQNARRKRL